MVGKHEGPADIGQTFAWVDGFSSAKSDAHCSRQLYIGFCPLLPSTNS